MSKICKTCGTTETSAWYEKQTLCRACYYRKWAKDNKQLKKYNHDRYLRNKKKLNPINCTCCGKEFMPRRSDNKYCSKYCADKHSRSKRQGEINKYFVDLYNNNLNRRLSHCMRSRINKALNGAHKQQTTLDLVGCSPEDLKQHLEDQFADGMSWDNYGLHGWHIDHIRPLSGFDLSDPEELKEACHYTNLQPLWATDNLSKGNR